MALSTRFAFLVVVASCAMGTPPADACEYEGGPVYLASPSRASELLLPSHPTLFLFVADNATIELESDGRPVPHRIVPTSSPAVKRVEVDLEAGFLVVRATSDRRSEVVHGYRVTPELVPSHKVRSIDAWVMSGGGEPWIQVAIDADALLYQVVWSDGQIDLRSIVALDRPQRRGLSFRIVGLFADGSEATVLESEYVGPDEIPPALAPSLRGWLIVLGGSLLLLIGIARSERRRECVAV